MKNIALLSKDDKTVLFTQTAAKMEFKGEGTCCGGGSTKPKKKKLKGKVICTYTFHIDGMADDNCKTMEDIKWKRRLPDSHR